MFPKITSERVLVVSGATTMDWASGQYYKIWSITTSGAIAIPTPCGDTNGTWVVVCNDNAGSSSLTCTNGFLNDGDSVAIPAGSGVILACVPKSDTSYRWVVFAG
jgi:hypothetical protein